MSYETKAPRRALVPGPNSGGIAAQAIAVREARAPMMQAAPAQHPIPVQPRMPLVSVPKLTAGIAGVMLEVGTIPKRGVNKFHNYNYVLMEDLLEAITPLMGKHGIVLFQNQVEIRSVENRLVVDYDFIVSHTSGEAMGPLRQPGMCIARNSKGDYDDKALAKCHTQARKYFILSLFQVPAGDFEADGDEGQQEPAGKKPVPGPSQQAPSEKKDEPPKPVLPQRIGLGHGAGPEQWAARFISVVGAAKTSDELQQWENLNDATLSIISDKHPELYERIGAAVVRRTAELQPKQSATTLPQDNQEAMNWIAGQLAQMATYEAAEQFWNATVAPEEKRFDEVDWGMLLQEWDRTCTRLGVQLEAQEQADARAEQQ